MASDETQRQLEGLNIYHAIEADRQRVVETLKALRVASDDSGFVEAYNSGVSAAIIAVEGMGD